MAYIDEASRLGRTPFQICELELDFCQHTFGNSPCTAIGEKCFNTLGTCKDLANYAKSTKVYKFTDVGVYAPVGFTAFPAIRKITYSPTKLEFGKGLGYRSKMRVEFQDFKHHDRGIDPYQSDRTYDTSRGHFFKKLIARNKYYNGRPMTIFNGYNVRKNKQFQNLVPSNQLTPGEFIFPTFVLGDSTYRFFNTNDFQSRLYIIENVEIREDSIVITGKDILKKLDKNRTQVPVANSGVLKADMTNTSTTLTLTDASFAEYPTSGYIRIDDEIIQYTGKTSTDTLTGLVRARYGTIAEDHSTDETVQLCKIWTNVNVVDIIYDILVNYGDIDPSYIPYDNGSTGIDQEWDIEQDTFLSYANYTCVLSEPEGADKLLEEITEQSMLMLWWDDKAQKIHLKALTQPTQRDAIKTLTDEYSFIDSTVKMKNKEDDRYSQLWIYRNPRNWTKVKEPEHFSTVYIGAELETESADRYGDKRVKAIFSRWLSTPTQPKTLYTRFSQLYTDAPREFTARLDAKDSDIQTGDYVDIITQQYQDETGQPVAIRCFVTEVKDSEIGHTIDITALSTTFSTTNRYAYVAPNTIGDYTAETDANKALYGFIGGNSVAFPSDNGDYYRII